MSNFLFYDQVFKQNLTLRKTWRKRASRLVLKTLSPNPEQMPCLYMEKFFGKSILTVWRNEWVLCWCSVWCELGCLTECIWFRRNLPLQRLGKKIKQSCCLKGANGTRWLHSAGDRRKEGRGRRESGEWRRRGGEKRKGNFILIRATAFQQLSLPVCASAFKKPGLIWVEPFRAEMAVLAGRVGLVWSAGILQILSPHPVLHGVAGWWWWWWGRGPKGGRSRGRELERCRSKWTRVLSGRMTAQPVSVSEFAHLSGSCTQLCADVQIPFLWQTLPGARGWKVSCMLTKQWAIFFPRWKVGCFKWDSQRNRSANLWTLF